MSCMDPDQLRKLAEADAIAESRAKKLLRRSQPGGAPAQMSFVGVAAHRREQLQSETLGGERRGRVARSQLGDEAPAEPAETAAAKLGDLVERPRDAVRRTVRLDERDPRPLRPEPCRVAGARRHGQRTAMVQMHRAVGEELRQAAFEHDREVRGLGLEGLLNIVRGKAKLAEREAVHVRHGRQDTVVLRHGRERSVHVHSDRELQH